MATYNNIKLNRVHYIPKKIEPGILYVSEEFGTAIHICPCGCGNKISTPITPPNWSLKIIRGKPTLYPSIGNWQLPCRSHYWIAKGEIIWAEQWGEEKINKTREFEQMTLRSFYVEGHKKREKKSAIQKFLNWIAGK